MSDKETPSFAEALDWAFSQIITPDNMLPTADEQKAWLLKEHEAATQRARIEELDDLQMADVQDKTLEGFLTIRGLDHVQDRLAQLKDTPLRSGDEQ